jgi:ATP-dependent RNA helicase HelY
LDQFQIQALDALDAGHSVLVAAPTGSGKTLVAEYAIRLALGARTKTFYTTPLKALSNQKYGDLVREYGPDSVGLLTGDNSINPDAAVVVMTTEVLRNMIYAASPTLHNLRYVVLDEVHYLQNRFRGAVWEEVIIHLPPEVDLVCLSATVSNAEEFADWIRTVRGATTAVIEERRPVELQHLYAVGDRSAAELHLLPVLVGDGEDLHPNPEATRLDRRPSSPRTARPRRGKLYAPWRSELVERLRDESMLPAIYFIFSRNACNDAVVQARRDGLRLTEVAERVELREIAERRTAGLSDDDLDALGYDDWVTGLEAGFAAHHAGLVPPMKEAVEEAFGRGLVKVVFATETLGLGINMPARSVVIEKLSKFTGEHHELLTAGEYTQLSGRAGRRGIDEVGYSVVCWNPYVPFDQVAALVGRRSYALTSSFRPTYNMAVNLVRRCTRERAHELLNLSFAQYHADRDVVSLERQSARLRDQLRRLRATAADDTGDLTDYRARLVELDAARTSTGVERVSRIEALRPGDIVRAPRLGNAVVIKQDRGRAPARILVVSESGRVVRLHADDLPLGAPRLGTVELPRPFQPRNPEFVRKVADRLVRAPLQNPERSGADELEQAERAVRDHPLADNPHLAVRLRAAAGVDRAERELVRVERRVRAREESLARQLDRVLDVLGTWGYVDGWQLTSAGALLCGLYTESDLLLAEALRTGALDDLGVDELAAVASSFTFERRGPDGDEPRPPRAWPSREVAQRCRTIERIWRELVNAEHDARLPESRPPDPGFTAAAAGWVGGAALADLLDGEEMTGGDFVRNVKQLIDLLRQIALVSPNASTRSVASDAADACRRGVVEASSAIGI